MHYDVFNGDADGIIALLQLRWAEPKASTLITGVKRDIALLKQVGKDAASVTVLDISMEKNIEPLRALLEAEVPVFYCDHHRCGIPPSSHSLRTLIDTSATVCTSLLINQYLDQAFVMWAIAAAFGDNLHASAEQLAKQHQLTEAEQAQLCELGTLINYNGYGSRIEDLHFHPAELFRALQAYRDPFALIAAPDSPYHQLKHGYQQDMAHIQALAPEIENDACRVFVLPDAPWARRISGVFGNQLVHQAPKQAHAVLTLNPDGEHYTVSVRAPLEHPAKAKDGADEVCCQFATGGGRKAAAGINALPKTELSSFIDVLNQYYQA